MEIYKIQALLLYSIAFYIIYYYMISLENS